MPLRAKIFLDSGKSLHSLDYIRITVAHTRQVKMAVCGQILPVPNYEGTYPISARLSDVSNMQLGHVYRDSQGFKLSLLPRIKLAPITRQEFLANVVQNLTRQELMSIWKATMDEYVEACLASGTPINWLT